MLHAAVLPLVPLLQVLFLAAVAVNRAVAHQVASALLAAEEGDNTAKSKLAVFPGIKLK